MNLYFDTVFEQIAEMADSDLLRSAQERCQTRTLAYAGCALHRETKNAKSESTPSCNSAIGYIAAVHKLPGREQWNFCERDRKLAEAWERRRINRKAMCRDKALAS